MAAPRSPAENDLLSRMGGNMHVHWLWIACNKESGEWMCEGQEKDDVFYHWRQDEPSGSGNCASIYTCSSSNKEYGQWNDLSCAGLLHLSGIVCIRRPQQPCRKSLPTYISGRLLSSSCLLDHVIREFVSRIASQCAVACINEPDCRSFNIRMKDEQQFCQLNNSTRVEDPSKFQDVSSFCVYYEQEAE